MTVPSTEAPRYKAYPNLEGRIVAKEDLNGIVRAGYEFFKSQQLIRKIRQLGTFTFLKRNMCIQMVIFQPVNKGR